LRGGRRLTYADSRLQNLPTVVAENLVLEQQLIDASSENVQYLEVAVYSLLNPLRVFVTVKRPPG
jgi:hypothetical protein